MKIFTVILILGIFAICFFNTSCSKDEKIPEDVLLTYVRASSLYSGGKFKEAVAILDEKENAKSFANFIPALIVKGKAKYFLGEIDSAEKDFSAVLKKQPYHTDAGLFSARILREKGDKPAALRLVERMLSNDPADVRVLRFAAELTKDDERGSAQSLSYLNRAAEAGTESAIVLIERARRHWIAGRVDDAMNDIQGARALTGEDSPLRKVISGLEASIMGGSH